jgi:hypothetical protein
LHLPKICPSPFKYRFGSSCILRIWPSIKRYIQDLDYVGVASVRGTKTWMILSRFKTMAYVARTTTGVTIASEERLRKGIAHTPERL